MHRLDSLSFEGRFHIKIEIRRIDPNEYVRALLQETGFELVANAHKLAVMAHHLPAVAMQRQGVVRPPSLKATLSHLGATDADRCQRGPALVQAIEQQALSLIHI